MTLTNKGTYKDWTTPRSCRYYLWSWWFWRRSSVLAVDLSHPFVLRLCEPDLNPFEMPYKCVDWVSQNEYSFYKMMNRSFKFNSWFRLRFSSMGFIDSAFGHGRCVCNLKQVCEQHQLRMTIPKVTVPMANQISPLCSSPLITMISTCTHPHSDDSS